MVTRKKADLVAPASPMRYLALPITGALMAGMGGYVIFANPNLPAIPLWFVWLGGFLLWCVGGGLCTGGVAWALLSAAARRGQAEVPVRQLAPTPLTLAEAVPDIAGWAD